MATLQVKGMDDGLYRALASRAARENRSISQQVVTMIQEGLVQPGHGLREATEQFLALAGSWEDPRTARQIAADLRKQRRSGRRLGGDTDVFD